MRTSIKLTLVGVTAFCVAATVAHVNNEQKRKQLCEQKAMIDRALLVCAASEACVITLADAERLVDITIACTRN